MVDNGVDVSVAPNSSVMLEPAESLTFQLQPHSTPHAVLTIRNASDERKVAFKVKTTRPLRYLVRPNQGMLGPNGSASIMIILQQKDCDELLRLDPSERQLSNDKFLVQSVYIDDEFYELTKSKSTKEIADELTKVLARTDKESLSNKKLRCRFVQEDKLETGSRANSSSSMGTSESLTRRLSSNSSQMMSTRASARDQQDSVVSTDSNLATPEQLTSALLQQSSSADEGSSIDRQHLDSFVQAKGSNMQTSDPAGGQAKESVQDIAALRKKYEELVAFTVQLTAQRDVLISDLEKTRQLLQKANADVQRARKVSDEPGGSTLRQRRNGTSPAAANTNSSDAARGITGKAGDEVQAFGLFHLLICAIIFFLVGRYF